MHIPVSGTWCKATICGIMTECTSVPELNGLFCPTDIILLFSLFGQKLYFQAIFSSPGRTTYILMKLADIVSGNG